MKNYITLAFEDGEYKPEPKMLAGHNIDYALAFTQMSRKKVVVKVSPSQESILQWSQFCAFATNAVICICVFLLV